MSYLEGHCRAVRRMIEDDTYCIDVIHQIEAIESALRKVKEKILAEHLATCVTTAIKGEDEQERQKVISELLEVYEKIC